MRGLKAGWWQQLHWKNSAQRPSSDGLISSFECIPGPCAETVPAATKHAFDKPAPGVHVGLV